MPSALIRFFSATGNSHLAAHLVEDGLRSAGWNVMVEDIRSVTDPSAGLDGKDFLGFVFPIYAFRAALAMEEHWKKLPVAETPRPIFLLATYGGMLERALMRSRDILLPSGYVPVCTETLACEDSWTVVRFQKFVFNRGCPTAEDRRNLTVFARETLPRVWERNREHPVDAVSWFPVTPLTPLAWIYPWVVGSPTLFPIVVDAKKCVKCGTCEQKCPTGRMKMSAFPRPVGNCLGCYGCINACPQDAIDTWFTSGQARYRGPSDPGPA